ncbi:MAG TPA: hypothetical protein VKO84_03685 [Gaiellaceae bacterium]|nr:hypothetical protein [Gaiellaceae bacterium]
MRKLIVLLVGTAVLCVPAVSLAGTPTPAQLATQVCKSLRAKDGNKTFRMTYHSFAGCLGKQKSQSKQDVSNAAKTCKTQRNDPTFATDYGNGKTFNEYYGTNGGKGKGAGANAYGKCVSIIARQNAQNDVSAGVAAAKTCKSLKSSDLATFQATYGKGKNAFGKCVAQQSKTTNG